MNIQNSLKKKYASNYDIAISDFIIGYQENEINNLNDLYEFAKYMHGFYPSVPYFEVANMIISNFNKDISIEEQCHIVFKSEFFGLNKVRLGHFMEIISYGESNNKILNIKKK